MNKLCLIVATTLAAVAFAIAQPVAAKGPGGGGWKAGGGNPHGFSQGRKRGWASAKRPPGWAKGRKTGWRGSSVPPGWSKPPNP